MKTLLTLLASSLALLCGCTTIAPSSPSTITAAQAQQITTDTQVAVSIADLVDPSLVPIFPVVGKVLPSAFANGPVNPAAFSAAVASIPGLTSKQIAEINGAGAALDLALTAYEIASGKTVAVYTDPNVETIVTAVAAGMNASASVISAQQAKLQR